MPGLGDRPPGDRYFRHPGHVVGLVVWSSAVGLLVLLIGVATATNDGLRADLGAAATAVPLAVRQLMLAVVQVTAVLVPVVVLGALATRRRWRRAGTLIGAAVVGVATSTLLNVLLDEPGAVRGSLGDDSWLISTRFPTAAYLAGAFAAVTVGKPWLSRNWRRAADLSMLWLAVTMAAAGSAGVPELALSVAVGGLAGGVVLVVLGAPNRWPSPASIASTLGQVGLEVTRLDVERAVGGRAQLYRAATADGTAYLKVYGQDSRDADLLYRGYRAVVLRDSGDGRPAPNIAHDVEHEALMLVLAATGGVSCPAVRAIAPLPDGSIVLAMEDIHGRRLDDLGAEDIGPDVLDEVWRQVVSLHRAGLAHRALRAANILVADDGHPVLIDLGFATAAADRRAQAIDRAELLASVAVVVGPGPAVASAARVLDGNDLAAAMPYLQPLAMSAATRRAAPGATLAELRSAVAEATTQEPPPLARLIRVRLRTVVTIATLAGAFYLLLPQLANVDDSVLALRSAHWGWLGATIVMSLLTYVAAAIGLLGSVRQPLPFVSTVEVALASSFVNRVTPANVGGMALNVRFMQQAGVPPAEAVTGVGLNVIAGFLVHFVLLVVFFAWAGQSEATPFAIPSSSTVLVVISVVLAVAGAVAATRWGRRAVRAHVLPSVRQSAASIASLGRSPSRLLALFGGSLGVTLAYAAALAFSVAAFDGGADFAQVGAVYLGAALIAAAAPTPGGLGAMEAALVAGLTGMEIDPAIAVAAVLSYRLVTFWLPILPGWLCFRFLDRRRYI